VNNRYVETVYFPRLRLMDGETSRDIAASPSMRTYFQHLQQEIDICYKLANTARKKGCDPELTVEIPQALDLAARVEQLVGPKGIAPKIRQATQKIGNRELVSLEISRMIADRKTYHFDTIEQALDQAIRTGLAILTEGVLVAPLEGIAEVRVGRNNDGTNYVDLYFSGPIRSAGGTGQAMSVLIADVVRRDLGIGRYIATQGEIERLKEEIPLYKRVQHLQYLPSVDEIDLIMKNCPICINGEGTEDEEVAGYRDLPRVGTNRLRGGACLVIAEGLCLKAPKINKHIKKLKLPGWEFLDHFVTKGVEPSKESGEIPAIPPSYKYIGEVIAGRPVLSHPSRKGGFRLRYGRARTAGLASTAINPATMFLLDSFITVGTQMKTERPGKGTIGTPCDQIEGPIVLLLNGDLVQINDVKNIRNDIKKIIDLGEILIPFGEFIENNSLLPDSSYVYEWWVQELQTKEGCLPKNNTAAEIITAEQTLQHIIDNKIGRHIDLHNPTPTDAFLLSEQYQVPLHPSSNLFWHDIPITDHQKLITFIKDHGTLQTEDQLTLILPNNQEMKNILIELGALHTQREGTLRITHYAYPLVRCCGLDITNGSITPTERFREPSEKETTLSYVSTLAGVTIRPRAPFRIGTRMGRPEKASPRKMRPPPHVLFPLGDYGGNQRLVKNAAENVTIEVEAGKRRCPKCKEITFHLQCTCGTHTEVIEGKQEKLQINLSEELEKAQKNLKEHSLPETIKGVIGTISKHKTPEPLEKGILRAKHNVYVFKDGTIRFDMTDAPLTHFKPKEIGVPIKQLKELGYENDYLGNDLQNDEQICELKVQDVIISVACADYFVQVTKFIDELLTKFYHVDRYYKVKKNQDLVGHLVVGLAPHTSAGALGRIIGFTSAQVCFMHPFFHATKRRNCLVPDTSLYLTDFSQSTKISLQDLYDSTNSQEQRVDSFGTTLKQVKNLQTYSCNPLTGQLETQKILSVLRTPAPRHLVKVTLMSGKSFTSSPAHRIVVWQKNKLRRKKIIQITQDDKLLICKSNTSKLFRENLFGDFILDKIKTIVPVVSTTDFLYDIEVEKFHNFIINDYIVSNNCDGDEDGLMLLMDALLNFSHSYIPDKRGGKMDLPLILTTRLDPSEVDKEAHNLDTLSRYPLEFYEATLRHEHSKNLESKMGLVASRLGTELQYEQFGFTHDTDDISEGPKESLYKTLKSMMEKMNVQLSLAAKIRAVDEADVAYKVIERHFLPDILGNLRAFSKQSVRCPLCNTTYRRIPLQGVCTKCNGKLTLTVHEMSVKKYLDISKEIAEKYNLPVYARQRIALVEKSIDSMFVSDKVKNTKLTDFF
jgi:DNA polymerase II large subunit